MTHSGKKPDSKKARKQVLRRMKELTKLVEKHAQWHRDLLDEHWKQTDWTRKQAEQVLRRIDQVVSQLPEARKQAHERIIGERLVNNEDKILSEALCGDRGFDSESNRKLLDEKDIFNGLCPRQPQELKRRRHGARFQWLQHRRSQTEGRIGILKNDFLGSPMRNKGFESRKLGVVWSVLAHNLWVLVRLERVGESGCDRAEAA